MTEFDTALARAATLIQGRLDQALTEFTPLPVTDAMRYAVTGGKRLRGFLVLQSASLFDIPAQGALAAAAAVEALHAYSLVHDDLPAMDDDALRRGQPTVHVKWDEATAILAGDALQTMAFDLLCDPNLGSDATRLALISSFARASGAAGMVFGQALDIAAETSERALNLAEITTLQAGKTGALIEWSATAGARLAGADIAPLRAYACALGLAFQIADDILDVTGDASVAGKRLQKDAAAGKATFVSLLGLEGAQAKAADLIAEACDQLAPYGAKAEILIATARFAINRKH